tara:strand:+ start:342 stop:482 length:141 start_codon:yes stop_codon:yes gene_type:complete
MNAHYQLPLFLEKALNFLVADTECMTAGDVFTDYFINAYIELKSEM